MKAGEYITKYMAVIVLAVAAISFIFPPSFLWVKTSSINWLLGAVMLSMGMTIKAGDFKAVFTRPADVLLGCLAQFTIMPVLAWGLTILFRLPPDLATGVILVGCCPGGTSSNLMTFLAKGDVPLSVSMTAISTLLAPLLTPLLTWILAGQYVEVDIWKMLLSILEVVILPISAGILIQRLFSGFTAAVTPALPAISTIVITLIVGSVVSANSGRLQTAGLTVLAAVMLHNIGGYAIGYMTGRLLGMSRRKCIAISIEVGMQNSGLSCTLAAQHFPNMPSATVPGAVFSVWHNISGALAARLFRKTF